MGLLGNEKKEKNKSASPGLTSSFTPAADWTAPLGFSDVTSDSNDPKLRSSSPKLAPLPTSVGRTTLPDTQSMAPGKPLILPFSVSALSLVLPADVPLQMALFLTILSHDFKVIAHKTEQDYCIRKGISKKKTRQKN